MNHDSEDSGRVPTFDIPRWIDEVVRRSLLQAGAMQQLEEKMKEVSQRNADLGDADDGKHRHTGTH